MSISWKLAAGIAAVVTLVLGVTMAVLATGGIQALRAELLDDSSDTAELVGALCLPAIESGSQALAKATLERLDSHANVLSAQLYDASGALLASYHAPDVPRSEVPAQIQVGALESRQTADGYVEVLQSIQEAGQLRGMVRVRLSTSRIDAQVRTLWFTIGGALIGVILLGAVIAFTVQRIVSRPLLRLAQAAESVSRSQDYSTRLEPAGPGEIGTLVTSFNAMLGAIEEHEARHGRSREALREYAERLRLLREIDEAILAEWGLKDIAERALTGLRGVVSCRFFSVIAFDPQLEHQTTLARWPEGPDRGPVSLTTVQPWLDALRGGITYAVSDVPSDENAPGVAEVLQAWTARSLVSIPLYTENELLGALTLGFAETGPPKDTRTLEIAREVAETLAVSLRQARMAERIEHHTEDLEDRVKQRTSELEAQSRELEAFAYSVAHDLRSPLRAMQGYGIALRDDYRDALDAVGRGYVERICAAAERLDGLIGDLLEYSRLSVEEFDLEPVSLDAVVADVLIDLEARIVAGHAQVTVASPLGLATAHAGTLQQVVQNVVSNALKFVPKGETAAVHIETHRTERGPVRLVVSDNGIGIEAEHLARIFRVFERLHGRSDYPGTGIGLAIVKRGMERMDGSAGVESTENQGSRFWLELPRS